VFKLPAFGQGMTELDERPFPDRRQVAYIGVF